MIPSAPGTEASLKSSPSLAIKTFARSIGADLVGIAPAIPAREAQKHLEEFLSRNRHGSMRYLEDARKRTHPQELLPEAKSVIVIAVNYYREVPTTPPSHGRIARYAYGRDYHKVIKKLLEQIAEFIEKNHPEAVCKPCVDSAPLMEKSYAVQAGLGFLGKNTTLITPEFGSFVLLGELLTTLPLEYDRPHEGTCGTCTRCLDGCPTKALVAPGKMDATRCISYLTIERSRNESTPIPAALRAKMQNWIFGCDICQEVCPYNKVRAKPLQLPALKETKIAGHSIPLQEILAIQTDEEFTKKFAGSPVMRAKRAGLQNNARVAQQNARNIQTTSPANIPQDVSTFQSAKNLKI